MAHRTPSEPNHAAAHIPPFARPLAPYIRTRQETLRIRQALTIYLRSLITFADDDADRPDRHAQSHLSLCVPHEAVVDVKRTPPDVSGLRGEYLEALRANVAARKEYQSLCEGEASAPAPPTSETPKPDSTLELQAYLRLLRDRRQNSKLRVFQHHLQQIKARETVKPEDFERTDGKERLVVPEDWTQDEQSGGRPEADIEGLLHNLERAVVRAKSQLDREKRLFEELKARHDARENPDGIDPAVKLAALQRTRDELVQWRRWPPEEIPAEEIEESVRLLEEQKAQAMELYSDYVDARKRLLDAAARACQPIASASAKPPDRSPGPDKLITEPTPSLESLDALSFTSDVLLPLAKSQRALSLQKTYLAGLLGKEKSTTLRILNRLSDESHLLPEYPILARQPRFKHTATAAQKDPAKQDAVVSLAEAWAFASDAADSGNREFVEQKVLQGTETTEDAQQALQEIYGLLNQDLEETLREADGDGQGDNDIWASEARSIRSRTRANRSERRPKGPWSRLNGRIGVE
ncbi:hypothetical protein P168DRAFT_291953 [Aspergillus campestris IBT 28561]|uniref:Uncharacterized protein n=1 Tax=Aspergillus campestris (strain IBT 28561) TaxID=1392248 RepID=A0A2I1CZ17_ASPC2|nr:uncharacterized protein P168DRAFT_291953 [Aspergillus campestris IBT 28561]PKY02846.1 hypothetical protein P168DRAFT_291953 [Aspergillus campestris IBT 28561]